MPEQTSKGGRRRPPSFGLDMLIIVSRFFLVFFCLLCSSFIARIDAPIRQMVTQTKCAMPDTASLEARIADAVKDAARAGIAETTLNIEVHHSVQLEEATKERLDRKERRLENINKSFSDKPMEFWKREPCTVEMEHTTYYSITPSLSHFSRMSATL